MMISGENMAKTGGKQDVLIAYYRVSTEYQFKTQDTIPLQREACKKYAAKQGARIIAEYSEEEGVTGRSTDRPAYLAARDRLKNPDVDGLIVYEFDRWSRSKKASVLEIFEFQESKKKIYLARLGEIIDWTREGDDLIALVKAWIAENEADKIAGRLKMGRDRIKNGEGKKWGSWNEWKKKELTREDREKIEKMLKLGVPKTLIAEHFTISRQTLYNKINEWGIKYG